MLWAMFFWEALAPGIHMYVTLTHTTYIKIFTHQVTSLHSNGMRPISAGLCTLPHKKKLFRNDVRNMKKKMLIDC